MEIDGKRVRTLALPNQARNHFDSLNKANEVAKALAPSMKEKLGWDRIEVRSVTCWDCGDAKSIYFEHEKI
jgi:hypothetical protein